MRGALACWVRWWKGFAELSADWVRVFGALACWQCGWMRRLAVRAPPWRVGASRLGRTSCSTRRTRAIHGPLTPLPARTAQGASFFTLRSKSTLRGQVGGEERKPSTAPFYLDPILVLPLFFRSRLKPLLQGETGRPGSCGRGFGLCRPVMERWRSAGRAPFRDRRRHGCRLRAPRDGFTACPERAPSPQTRRNARTADPHRRPDHQQSRERSPKPAAGQSTPIKTRTSAKKKRPRIKAGPFQKHQGRCDHMQDQWLARITLVINPVATAISTYRSSTRRHSWPRGGGLSPCLR